MIVMLDTIKCTVTPVLWACKSHRIPIKYSIASKSSEASVTPTEIGHFERCPFTNQWVLVVTNNEVALSLAFTQKIWNSLWRKREEFLATTLNRIHHL